MRRSATFRTQQLSVTIPISSVAVVSAAHLTHEMIHLALFQPLLFSVIPKDADCPSSISARCKDVFGEASLSISAIVTNVSFGGRSPDMAFQETCVP
jgi:hypothetical protein